MHTLNDLECKNKAVFYRPDYNVPHQDGVIQDDFRITSSFPTLDILIQKGAKIVIGVHIGQPKGQPDPKLATRPVAERLADQYPKQVVTLANKVDDPEIEQTIAEMQPGDILVLPNLRFYPEEEENSEAFARQLAGLANFYVNDAFAGAHRAHASIVGIPKFLPSFAGLLLQKELENLSRLLENPEHPFVVVMGGAKVSDKIEVIQTLATQADHILIGGAMANTFLLAKGEDISDSVAEPDKIEVAEKLIKELGEKLVLAADYIKDVEKDQHFRYLDIGEKAVTEFKKYLGEAKTIFWNGSLGYSEDPRFAVATDAIARYIAGLKGVTSVVAGGDTVETITKLKLHDAITFISTGGGAALEFLAGKELPGVKALEEGVQKEEVKEEKVEAKEEESKEPETEKIEEEEVEAEITEEKKD